MVNEPRVSVVSPFYNTGTYIAEAIESVLAQSYSNFEYILANNRSTDGGDAIARRYAERDSRIRVVDNPAFLGKRENYNNALKQIGADSKYVKMLQVDDKLFPNCLRDMVEVAERDPRIGIVSSYFLNGDEPWGSGLSHDLFRMNGREAARLMLLTGCFLIGSPSVVMYRADVVRAREVFFEPSAVHADTIAGYEILLEHDLGYVHQIESFVRTQADSTTGRDLGFNPGPLDYLISIERFGPRVLSDAEYRRLSARDWNSYMRFLGSSLLRAREKAFWDYHRHGLATIGHDLTMLEVLPGAAKSAAQLAFNPLTTIERAVAGLSAKLSRIDARPPETK